MNIILASQSPRRKELLAKLEYEFEIIPSDIEEIISSTEPDMVVMELARQKALDVYDKCMYSTNEGSIVIGADTIVCLDGEILGKPQTKEDAFYMIESLQGRTHDVYTGVSIVWDGGIRTFNECTKVTFYAMSEDEIRNYLAKNDCMDKAGAYGIQGEAAIYIEKIAGDYNNVVGLPIARLYHELKDIVR